MSLVFPRRYVLKALAGLGTVLLPLRAKALDSGNGAEPVQTDLLWSYEDVTGPEHWSELSPDYSLCQFGVRQSPVDLIDATKRSRPDTIRLDYRPVTAKSVRDPVGLKITLEPGCQIALYGKDYALSEFRFRRPSEHLLSGQALEMEMQFLHVAENGDQAMLAVFLRQGADNPGIAAILANAAVDATFDQVDPVFPLMVLAKGKQKEPGKNQFQWDLPFVLI